MKLMQWMLIVLLMHVSGVEAGCKYNWRKPWQYADCKAREAAEASARWAREQAENAARVAREAAEAVARETKRLADAAAKLAMDLATRTACIAKTGVTTSVDVAKNLAGKAIIFDEVAVEGTLGGATFAVKAKGSFAGKSFTLSSSVGKDGFSQDGFKKLFYDPLAKLF